MAMSAEVKLITPAIAEAFLNTMGHNRKLSTRNVTNLAEQMRDGLWKYDGSPIRFNEEGQLIDGQHRMWALIEAEYSAEFLVLTGIEQAAMATMDTGKRRTFADVLSLEDGDIPQVTSVAGAVQVVYRWEQGDRGSALVSGGGTHPVPNAVLLDFFRANRPRLVDVTRQGNTTSKRVRGLGQSTLALGYWVFDAIDAADAEYFFDHLASGAGLPEGDAILALRNYLIRATHGVDIRTKLPVDLGVALLIKAWNNYREGNPVRTITFRRGGANPEAFPTPK